MARYQTNGVAKLPNKKLSELDKAFIMLNYPPDLTDPKIGQERLAPFMAAIREAGLETKAGQIMQAFVDPGPVSHRLQTVRKLVSQYSRMSVLHECKCFDDGKI